MAELTRDDGIPSAARLAWFLQACILRFEMDLKERWEHLGDTAEASAYPD